MPLVDPLSFRSASGILAIFQILSIPCPLSLLSNHLQQQLQERCKTGHGDEKKRTALHSAKGQAARHTPRTPTKPGTEERKRDSDKGNAAEREGRRDENETETPFRSFRTGPGPRLHSIFPRGPRLRFKATPPPLQSLRSFLAEPAPSVPALRVPLRHPVGSFRCACGLAQASFSFRGFLMSRSRSSRRPSHPLFCSPSFVAAGVSLASLLQFFVWLGWL